MAYTVYKTTNLVNGKYYIGVHKTDNPNDGYLGSGRRLWQAITKYGWQNFKKEVLFDFSTLEEAFHKEEELVEIARRDPNCYNLNKGGRGGWDFLTDAERLAASRKGSEKWSKQGHSEEARSLISKAQSGLGNSQSGTCWINNGRESKKVPKSDLAGWVQQGWKVGRIALDSMRNFLPSPNKGRVCITKDGQSRTIDPTKLQDFIKEGWKLGRK